MKIEHLLGWPAVGLVWWIIAFNFGFFDTIMKTIIFTAMLVIYFKLSEHFNWDVDIFKNK